MAKTLAELLAEKAELDRTIAEIQRTERAEALSKIHKLMDDYGISIADLGGVSRTAKPHPTAGVKVPPKYRDAKTGNTWSGRGLQPAWLKEALASGRKLSEFTV
jgi:DNA-binding protein H-NS